MDLMSVRRAIILSSPPTGSNIFNLNVPRKNPSSTAFSNATKRIFTPYTYCVGASWSNYYNAANINSFSKAGGVLTVNSKQGYGVGYAIPVKGITSVKVKANVSSNGVVRVCYYDSTGERITYGDIEVSNATLTIPANAVMMVLVFGTSVYSPSTDATFSGIKVTPTYA